MKTNILTRCANYDFKSLLEKKGYAYFTKGSYNLNIIGVRTNHGNAVTNEFDDAIVVLYKSPGGKESRFVAPITTEPGLTPMLNPTHKLGTAIMVPGQYRGCWSIGLHQGKYQALCQRKPVRVYRDRNRNRSYDLDVKSIDTGVFGINIHKAGVVSKLVDKWSAGCQVFKTEADFDAFMRLCKQQVASGRGETFTYTLLNESEL